jgi:hypothetical protein
VLPKKRSGTPKALLPQYLQLSLEKDPLSRFLRPYIIDEGPGNGIGGNGNGDSISVHFSSEKRELGFIG